MMQPIVRTPATLVWVLLVVATMFSWMLGTDHGVADRSLASVVILLVAFLKVRFIGLYFMELREASAVLRALFEGYSLVVCALLVTVFVVS